jgi:hypothetical protein
MPFIGKINGLANGPYEVRENTNGRTTIIVPRKCKRRTIKSAVFNIKVSFKTSELTEGSKDARYAIDRMQESGSVTSIGITTIDGKTNYVLLVDGEWLGTVMDAKKNVSSMADISALVGKEIKFIGLPAGNDNTIVTSTGSFRTANVMTFKVTDRDINPVVAADEDVSAIGDLTWDDIHDEIDYYEDNYFVSTVDTTPSEHNPEYVPSESEDDRQLGDVILSQEEIDALSDM